MTNVNLPPKQPLSVTIITPCLNRASTIRETLESVASQAYPSIQHIVVDGGSTDGTLEVLREYPGVTVISRPGAGLYEALNLGIKASSGDVIGQLNGDDLYARGAIAAVAETFSEQVVDSVCGGAEMFEDLAAGRRVVARLNGRSMKQLRLANIIHGIPMINARFFRRAVYERVGLYEEKYRIVSDRDFLLRAHCAGISEVQLRQVICQYRTHQDSLTLSGAPSREMLEENVLAAEEGRLRAGADACRVSAYRRWHAWAVGYMVGSDVTHGQYRVAMRNALRTVRTNPLWPLIFASQAITHWAERHDRRWSDENA